jgi:hypothetical protein
MLDIIYIILFLFALILLFYAIMNRIPFIALLDSILWLILALFTIKGVEVSTMIYNATTGAYDPYLQTIASDDMVYLSYIWMLLGIIMMIFMITFMLETSYKGPKEL